MFYIDKLKEKITEAQTGLTAALAYIESPEYRAQCEANYGKSVDMYPSMLGYLKAAADDARAREHDQALNALTDAGFDPDDDDDDILTCCSCGTHSRCIRSGRCWRNTAARRTRCAGRRFHP